MCFVPLQFSLLLCDLFDLMEMAWPRIIAVRRCEKNMYFFELRIHDEHSPRNWFLFSTRLSGMQVYGRVHSRDLVSWNEWMCQTLLRVTHMQTRLLFNDWTDFYFSFRVFSARLRRNPDIIYEFYWRKPFGECRKLLFAGRPRLRHERAHGTHICSAILSWLRFGPTPSR